MYEDDDEELQEDLQEDDGDKGEDDCDLMLERLWEQGQ